MTEQAVPAGVLEWLDLTPGYDPYAATIRFVVGKKWRPIF